MKGCKREKFKSDNGNRNIAEMKHKLAKHKTSHKTLLISVCSLVTDMFQPYFDNFNVQSRDSNILRSTIVPLILHKFFTLFVCLIMTETS